MDDHPLYDLVPDPSGQQPMCGEQEFGAILRAAVAERAPRLFAIVQEYGTRVDWHIAVWGMARPGHVDVVSVDRTLRIGAEQAQDTLRGFGWGDRITPRLVWHDPAAAVRNGRPAPG